MDWFLYDRDLRRERVKKYNNYCKMNYKINKKNKKYAEMLWKIFYFLKQKYTLNS